MRGKLASLKKQSLFVKLFLVTLISIIAVSLLSVAITIRMSENLFLKTFSITNEKLLGQVKSNLESYNSAVATSATQIAQSGVIRNYLTSGESDAASMSMQTYTMTERLKSIKSNLSAYEVGVTLIGTNGRSYTTDPWYWSMTAEELKNHEITKQTEAHPRQIMYQLYDGKKESGKEEEPILVASKALYQHSTGQIYGKMYVMLRDSYFQSFYENFTSEGNDVLLMNSQGQIVSSNRSELIGQTDAALLHTVTEQEESGVSSSNLSFNGSELTVLSEYLPEFDFYLVNLLDKDIAMGDMVNVKALTLTIMSIVLLSLIVVYLITRKMTKSMRGLVSHMSRIPTSGFNHRVDVTKSGYEVEELGNAFNYVLDELNDYVDRLVETQKQQRKAELAALQMQINPHFLYNTLASVKFLVQQGNKEKAAETINALITLLQNTVSNVQSTVTVRQELDTLKNYIFINHVRYGEKIRVSYFIEPDSMDYQVPKLMLQPFIENAFFHAFNQKGEGTIFIMISVQDEHLVCEVNDNGDGMDLGSSESGEDGVFPKTKRNRQLFSGIGIQNVDHRLKFMYGESYGVDINSKLGEGTKIKITLPLVKQDEESI
ncbi:sensor histidine kinase [Paenibacillus sp. Marseille-Q4541]|uniref:cache domain-containing sensor histidine kinase n=1 Tax=Paenibacillus sp. Marseille-Q4541 TaxID=2831522 RepID=UPI001BA9667F|nr:sensor histidine kinase [Paenibacillus sp. Marseille-Q4541]